MPAVARGACTRILRGRARRSRCWLPRYEITALACFLASRDGVAPSDLFVPGRMKRPSPRFTDRAANHGSERPGLADGAEINVDEDSAQHDHGRKVVKNVADGYRPASE